SPCPCCRLSYQRNDDDDEEAARERRRRARQERLRQKEEGDLSGEGTEKSELNAQNSVAGEESKRSTDDEAALLERLARREERRQKRLQEALERQKEFDPTITDGSLSLPSRREVNNVEENESTGKEEKKAETRQGRYEIEETETVTKSYQRNNWRQDGEEEEKKEEKGKEEEKPKELPTDENQVDVTAEKSTDKEEAVTVNAEEHKAENDTNAVPEGTQSDAVDKEKLRDEEKAEEERKEAEERERLKAEEEKRAAEEKQKAEEEKRAAEEKQKAEEEKRAAEERAKAEEEKRAAEERERAKAEEERKAAEEKQKAEEEKRAAEERAKAEEEKRAAEEKAKLEAEKLKEKQKMEEQKIEEKQVKEKKVEDEKPQAAFLKKQEEEKVEAKKEKLPEEKLQATSIKDQQVKDDKGKAPKEEMKSVWDRKKGVPEQKAQNGERELPASKLKPTENAFGLEDQRRRRGGSESEELEKLKEKQQEAAAELGELKKRREERRKVLEEEEQKKKQEEAERKIKEEASEKRRMKEEIERRRAEAAEKRQKMPEDGVSEDKKPFKCFSPKGSSLKIEERTEFLNKSAQKSGMKPSQTTAVVSKIDSRLEQYTSAIEGTKASRPAKASDLHVPAEGVRNIKSMWEKGNVFSSPSGTGTPNKETAGLKVGVSSRINEWLTKTPESNKSPAPKPSDLRPGDVSGKRNLWEKQSVEKPAASSKVIT
ncbi:CALD1 protein, partial [Certhia familiaris]|nr:CALD1 protein [Certhia familiaris]